MALKRFALEPLPGHSGYHPIACYAIVGDCRAAALIAHDGSIDWLCLPDFHSPSVFARLLDQLRGGAFRIRPTGRCEVTRCYRDATAIVETTFHTERGVVRLVDAMSLFTERGELAPDHELVRIVECLEGEVEMQLDYEPRPDYGQPAELDDKGPHGIATDIGARRLALAGEIDLVPSEDGHRVSARFTVCAGEERRFSMTYSRSAPGVLLPLGDALDWRLARTDGWWRGWATRASISHRYRDAITRSLITLKLLSFTPSGAIVAAPTTSLPEVIGGSKNWDYRYCWLRDASMTLETLLELGYEEEGQAFFGWMMHTTRRGRGTLNTVYDVFGRRRALRERELDGFEGHRRSHPVRLGNAAQDQLQLDMYGEMLDMAARFNELGGKPDRATLRRLTSFGKLVMRRWREPDEGIWEKRSGRTHHTYSKVLCWTGLDRLLELDEAFDLSIDPAAVRRERDAIRSVVERDGFSEELNSYVGELGGRKLDASLLLLPRYGYIAPHHPRMLATTERIRERLMDGPLVHRYHDVDDGLSGEEAAFGICSFWFVALRASQGAVREACDQFESLLALGSDLGLYAEELDRSGEHYGNFPQAFTHLGLIDAALAIARAENDGRLDRILEPMLTEKSA